MCNALHPSLSFKEVVMHTPQHPSPSDFRAIIARKQLPIFKLAAAVGLHPTTLGQILNERKPMTDTVADRLAQILKAD
jgi:plasmid maintenance system antidote protein VapI